MSEEKNEVQRLAGEFARRLATQKLNPNDVEALAEQVLSTKERAVDLGVFPYGIIVDYWVEPKKVIDLLDLVVKQHGVGGIKIFPKGIIDPDMFQVSVEHYLRR